MCYGQNIKADEECCHLIKRDAQCLLVVSPVQFRPQPPLLLLGFLLLCAWNVPRQAVLLIPHRQYTVANFWFPRPTLGRSKRLFAANECIHVIRQVHLSEFLQFNRTRIWPSTSRFVLAQALTRWIALCPLATSKLRRTIRLG